MTLNIPTALRPAAAIMTADSHGTARSDAENQRLIEDYRERHNALIADRIRNDHDVRTHTQTIKDALAEAKAAFGTDDLDALRGIVLENHQKNTVATNAYTSAIDAAQQAVREVDAAAKST